MDAPVVLISCLVFCMAFIEAVPPEACFAKFRWDDCGHPPTPVMYYWKPGSRCEVGLWRGCYPNLNMFKNEYECVSTCIFTIKPRAEKWHEQLKLEEGYDFYDESPLTTGYPDDSESVSVSGSDIMPSNGSEISSDDKLDSLPSDNSVDDIPADDKNQEFDDKEAGNRSTKSSTTTTTELTTTTGPSSDNPNGNDTFGNGSSLLPGN